MRAQAHPAQPDFFYNARTFLAGYTPTTPFLGDGHVSSITELMTALDSFQQGLTFVLTNSSLGHGLAKRYDAGLGVR